MVEAAAESGDRRSRQDQVAEMIRFEDADPHAHFLAADSGSVDLFDLAASCSSACSLINDWMTALVDCSCSSSSKVRWKARQVLDLSYSSLAARYSSRAFSCMRNQAEASARARSASSPKRRMPRF